MQQVECPDERVKEQRLLHARLGIPGSMAKAYYAVAVSTA